MALAKERRLAAWVLENHRPITTSDDIGGNRF